MTTEFKYYLLEEDGRSLIVQNGIVTATSQKVPLLNSPIGWEDASIAWERDVNKIGLVRNFTIPLRFVLDGLKIIRTVAFTQSTERKIYLLLQQMKTIVDATTYQNKYFYLYKGLLDLVNLKDEDTQVSVPVVEYGTAKNVAANSSTVYEFSLDDLEAVPVKMDGISLSNVLHFQVTAATGTASVPLAYISSESQAPYIITASQNGASGISSQYFVKNEGGPNISVFVSGTVQFQADSNTQDVHVTLYKVNGTNQTILQQDDYLGVNTTDLYTASYNLSVSLADGDQLVIGTHVVPKATGNSQIQPILTYKQTSVDVSYHSRYKESFIYAFRPFTLFQKIVERVCGSKNYAVSSLLQQHTNIVITCGDGVRGLAGASIKTSLDDFYTFCKVVFCAGFGIENNRVVIESLDHFFSSPNKVDLGEAKDLQVSFATDLMFNTVRIGYRVNTSDNIDTELNGKYEFNNSFLFQAPVTSVNKELTLISPYNAQPYTIEKTRLNLDGKTTTDNSQDNEVFILNIDDSFEMFDIILNKPYYPLKRVAYDATSQGLPVAPGGTTPDFSSIFNIEELTPKRLLSKWMKYINSVLFQMAGQKLKFLTTEKNQYLRTVQGSVTIQENDDVEIGTDRYFLPVYFDCQNPVPVDLVDTMEQDAGTWFSTSWYNESYEGILMKGALAVSTRAAQSFKLLSSPDNDLSTLI